MTYGLTLWRNRLQDLMPEFFSEDGVRTFDPAIDIEEDTESYVLAADLPGFDEKEVELSIEDDVLTLKGSRRREAGSRRVRYSERADGAFCRAIRLPGSVDAARVTARMKGGVLTVTLPKREEAKAKIIPVSPA
jgi:HSP20 family protein